MNTKIFNSWEEASAFAKNLGQRGIANKLMRNGSSWLVEHDSDNGVDAPQNNTVSIKNLQRIIESKESEIHLLREKIKKERSDSISQIEDLEKTNAILQEKFDALQNNIDAEIASRTEEKKSNLEKTKADLSEELSAAKQDRDKLNIHLQNKFDAEIASRTEEKIRNLEKAKADLSEELSAIKRDRDKLNMQMHKLELLETEYTKHFGEAEIKVIKETSISKGLCPRCGGDGGVKGGCQKCDGHGWVDVKEETSREVAIKK